MSLSQPRALAQPLSSLTTLHKNMCKDKTNPPPRKTNYKLWLQEDVWSTALVDTQDISSSQVKPGNSLFQEY